MLPGGQLSGETGPGHGVLREIVSKIFPPCAKPFVTCRSGAIRSDVYVRFWHLADIDADAEHVRFRG